VKHSKAIELLTLILKGDNPKSNPDYHQAIRVGIQALEREMLLGIDEDQANKTWQREWPDKPGAWWFYGTMKQEADPALFVLIVHATKNEPPIYIAAWQQHIMQPGEIEGWFKWIPYPGMPDNAVLEVW
jgi:hypothetical protein